MVMPPNMGAHLSKSDGLVNPLESHWLANSKSGGAVDLNVHDNKGDESRLRLSGGESTTEGREKPGSLAVAEAPGLVSVKGSGRLHPGIPKCLDGRRA